MTHVLKISLTLKYEELVRGSNHNPTVVTLSQYKYYDIFQVYFWFRSHELNFLIEIRQSDFV